ncbi:uncharacterized protein LOC132634908 isoform X1 [Lycium barbarum]|uniref:uncharacterized protein LOC132634908 isoform X1 n=1 Tax=Lycium barbarum TaxID=112863 RepID=UPI00293EF2DF|nr:uncharacterized protein LOC132634908 isoform X1 [Lycium barbarum]XP_060207062.1 uncharacterized protein LOC132634908 isoform X1 [Lycium barbarum]
MDKKRSSRNPQQIEKSQLNCMWGLISSLYFGQNQRKQKLLSNGKAATKNFTGKKPRKLDALTCFNDQLYGFEDGGEVEALGVRMRGEMQKNTQIIARNEQHKEVDYGLFDHMISKYKPSSKKTCKNQSPLYDWKDTETGHFQQASGSAELSINKLKLASVLEAICSQIHQENGDSQRSIIKNDQFDEMSLQVLQTSAKAFIDQLFIDRKYISKRGMSYEPGQFSNALEMLNSNGDLFLKLLQDPNSLLAKQIRNMLNVQMARDSIKCFMSDKLSDGQSSESDIKHHRSASKESSSSRSSNKIVVLKPIPKTVQCSENISCHCSSMQYLHSTSSKGENVKRKNFYLKDIKRKLKYAMGQKWKEKHLLSVGSTLHKLHSISNKQNLEVDNEGNSSCLTIAGSINSFTGSNTTNEAENKQESFMTERVHKKVDVSALRYTKKRELDICMEAKKHLSQRLNFINTTGEAVMSEQPSRTLERILSSPEYDLKFNYSSKQDSKINPAEMRHNTSIAELPREPAFTSYQSSQRHKDCLHLNSSMAASPSEVWSPGSSTDVSSSSPYSLYKLRGDHQSPVSVLEPVFTDDLRSPSGNLPSDTALPPRRINFDGCLNKESPENPILNRGEPDALCIYIQSSLHILHLNWEELWLNRHLSEQMLDATLSDELETLALHCHSEPKLLMNYTNEVLLEAYDSHFRFLPWLSFVQPKICSFPLEKHLVEKVMKEVRQHLIPLMEELTLIEHVENDLAKSGSWLDIRNDAEDVLSQITDDVLEESILDVVLQLHTSFLCS